MEEKPEQKRAKPEEAPRSNVAKLSLFAKRPPSVYEDSSKDYASDDERRRAEIQSMVKTWKHYHTALDAYRLISPKTSDDHRVMRECHEKICLSYAEYPMPQLIAPHCIEALKFSITIPDEEKTLEDIAAVARIFPQLIVAVNQMIKALSINQAQVKECLVFCNNYYRSLNFKQRQPLDLSMVDRVGLESHTKFPWGAEMKAAAFEFINMVKSGDSKKIIFNGEDDATFKKPTLPASRLSPGKK
jgi:hypothetical protein